MRRRISNVLISVTAVALAMGLAACNPFAPAPDKPGHGATQVQDTPAMAAVRALYAVYQNPTPTPTGNAADWSGFRSKALGAAFDALPAKQLESEDPILDFDPIVGAQDWEISELALQESAGLEANQKVITATFKTMGDPRIIVFQMVEEDGAWKVDNVLSSGPNAYDVREIFTKAGIR